MTGRLPGILGTFAVLAVAGGLAAGSSLLPGLQRTAAPAAAGLPISRSTPSLICPGPETLLVPDGGTAVKPGAPVVISALVGSDSGPSAAKLEYLGKSSTAAADAADKVKAAGSKAVEVGKGKTLTLKADGAGPSLAALAGTALGPAVLRTAGAVVPGAALAAVQSTLVRSGDLRGLTATTCTGPAADSWLVGGSTEDGERLQLLLANPAATAVVVDLDVRGPKGKVKAPSGEGIVVPAGGEVPIFVDALAPGLKRVAVHVTTRAGRVRATLHASRLRGLDAGGADDVPVAAAAAKQQVVPGISLVNGYGKTAEDSSAAGSTAVRIAVPGAEEAVARIRLLDSSGSVELPRAAVVTVPAGGVVDVPVAGIPSGTYTAVVDSDVPVVAGALVGRGGVPGAGAVSEFAWAGAARPLAGTGYVVLPPGAHSTLSLVAAGRAGRLEVTEIAADGTSGPAQSVAIDAATAATVQLGPNVAAVRIDQVSGGPVGASMVSWVTDPLGSLISVLSVDLATPPEPQTDAVQDRTLGLP